MSDNKKWEITPEGKKAIEELSKKVDASMKAMDDAYIKLNNKFVCSVDGMGVYGDAIGMTLKTMKKMNDDSKDALDDLKRRLDKYSSAIAAELAKRGL